MVSTLNQDANGDIALDVYGNFEIVPGSAKAVALLVKRALLTKLGELPFSVEYGVDFDRIFQQSSEKLFVVDAILQNVILGVEGVDSILSFSSKLVGGQFVFSTQILTTYGTATISGNLGGAE